MLNTNWQDVYDEGTGTHMRVSPDVLQQLGYHGVLQVALHVKARNLTASLPNAHLATAYCPTVNGQKLFTGVVLLKGRGGRVPVFLICKYETWAKSCVGRVGRKGCN